VEEFVGEYSVNFSAKNRILIPAPLRGKLGTNLIVSTHNENWLEIYPLNYWKKFGLHLSKLSSLRSDLKDYYRLLYSQLLLVELDQQGRFILTEKMIANLNLDVESSLLKLTIVGVGEYIEIWQSEKWEIKKEFLEKNLPGISERLAFMLEQNNK